MIDQDLLEALTTITTVRPGDKLIIKIHTDITNEEADAICTAIRHALGDDTPFAIIDNLGDVFILREENTHDL